MKVLAINGSPRGAKGNTEFLIKLFLEGAREAGAETETIYLKDKDIHHCSGCFTCWTKTPGKCVYNDDMNELLTKYCDADLIVYGTPLYYFTYSGLMKDFMDRTLSLLNGDLIKTEDGYCHHLRDNNANNIKYVLISNCGFPGADNFSGLLETFKVCYKGSVAGCILIPEGGILNVIDNNEYLSKLYAPFVQALKDAGKEVVTSGHITTETQKILDKEYIPPEIYAKNANENWN